MSTIRDGSFKFWQTRQPNLMPLSEMRHVEGLLASKQAKSILEVGLDLTAIAVLAYAKEASADVTIVLPGKGALVKDLRRISGQLSLDISGLVEATKAVGGFPVELPEDVRNSKYDFVRLFGYATAPLHRGEIIAQLVPVLEDGATLVVHPCGPELESQLIQDFSLHVQSFDLNRCGQTMCITTTGGAAKPVETATAVTPTQVPLEEDVEPELDPEDEVEATYPEEPESDEESLDIDIPEEPAIAESDDDEEYGEDDDGPEWPPTPPSS